MVKVGVQVKRHVSFNVVDIVSVKKGKLLTGSLEDLSYYSKALQKGLKPTSNINLQ